MAKTKEPAAEQIMASSKMKPMLTRSKIEAVQAAFSLTDDGEAVILLDRKAKPKGVAGLLKVAATKAKITLNPATIRYGRAEVDTDYDPGMVRFFINKEAPGTMRAHLVEVVRRMSYQKVEINVEPGLDDDEVAASPAAEPAPPPPAPPPPAPPPPPQAKALDPAALSRDLAALVTRFAALPDTQADKPKLIQLAREANILIKTNNLRTAADLIARLRTVGAATPAAPPATPADELATVARQIAAVTDPARKAALAKLAGEANAAIKARDPAAIAAAMATLRDGMRPRAEAAPVGPAVAFAQARLRYDTARKQIHADLGKLTVAMREFFQDEPDFDAIDGAIGKFETFREQLDERLIDALDQGYSGSDLEGARSKALRIIGEYQAMLSNNSQLLNGLDDNPFVPVAVEKTLPSLLADLAAQLG